MFDFLSAPVAQRKRFVSPAGHAAQNLWIYQWKACAGDH